MGTLTMRPAFVARLTRFRVVALAVVGLLAFVACVSIWRMRSADELPDIGDPFDVALALRPILIPDGDNAFSAYAQARTVSGAEPGALAGDLEMPDRCIDMVEGETRAPCVSASNRAALQIWRDGSERPDALYHQPSETAYISPPLHLLQRSWCTRAWPPWRVRGWKSRLQWPTHGSGTGRCCDRAGWSEGMARFMTGELAPTCTSWPRGAFCAGRPILASSAAMLRRSLDDVSAADRLTPPLSDALKLEYLMALRDLDELITIPEKSLCPAAQADYSVACPRP